MEFQVSIGLIGNAVEAFGSVRSWKEWAVARGQGRLSDFCGTNVLQFSDRRQIYKPPFVPGRHKPLTIVTMTPGKAKKNEQKTPDAATVAVFNPPWLDLLFSGMVVQALPIANRLRDSDSDSTGLGTIY